MLQTYGLTLAYEGKNLKYDQDCLIALTPSLFAFATTIKEVLDIIQPNTQPLSISIVTGTNFGFLYRLSSQDQYTFHNLIRYIKSEPIKQAINYNNLFDTIVKLFDFIKNVNNREIVDYHELPGQNVQVMFSDNEFLDTTNSVFTAYNNAKLRQDIMDTLKPLKTLGAERFTVYTESDQYINYK